MDDSTEAGSDHEGHNKNDSPTRSLPHAEDSDGGENIDLDEDTDLHGQDSRRLRDTFQAEVYLEF